MTEPFMRDVRVAQRGGRTAVHAGRRAEQLVEWACKRLEQEGRAWIRKTEPGVGIVPRHGTVFFRAGGPPDFMGFLAGGRGVCFDLKTTAGRAFEWKVRTGRSPREAFRHARTKERQLADLEGAGGVGALAGLLLILESASASPPGPRCVWIDWRGLRRLAEGRWTTAQILGLLPAVEAVWKGGEDPRWLEAALRADGGSPSAP